MPRITTDKFTYFAEESDIGRIKIGSSGNPEKRVHDIGTGLPMGLQLLTYCDFLGERDTHIDFKYENIVGEWFYPSLRLSIFIHNIQQFQKDFHHIDWTAFEILYRCTIAELFDTGINIYAATPFNYLIEREDQKPACYNYFRSIIIPPQDGFKNLSSTPSTRVNWTYKKNPNNCWEYCKNIGKDILIGKDVEWEYLSRNWDESKKSQT